MRKERAAGPAWLRNGRTWGGQLLDIEVDRGRISRVVPRGEAPAGGQWWDADGGLVLPGLWDHHVHVDQWAIAAARVSLAGAAEPFDVVDLMRAALRERGGQEILAGYGFRGESWLGSVSSRDLDLVSSQVPVLAISTDFHSVWLNTPALHLARTLMPVSGDGVVREEEWFELAAKIQPFEPNDIDAMVLRAAADAAARGIVGVVDMEKGAAFRSWQRRLDAGFDRLRVRASAWEEGLDDAIAAGLRSGDQLTEASELGVMGPLKVIADGSLNSRTAATRKPFESGERGRLLKDAAELTDLLARAGAAAIEGAIHAIGDFAVEQALDAFAAAGASGAIEHAQLLEDRDIRRMAQLSLRASVQPRHMIADHATIEKLWGARAPHAYRFKDLLDAGVRLELGSDAPVVPLDPWQAICGAAYRTEGDHEPWHPDQCIGLERALVASMPQRYAGEEPGDRLVPRVGDVADLVVLDHDPRTVTPAELWCLPVASTMVAGRWTHGAR